VYYGQETFRGQIYYGFETEASGNLWQLLSAGTSIVALDLARFDASHFLQLFSKILVIRLLLNCAVW